MITSIVFDALFNLWILAAFGVTAIVLLALAMWRGLPGWAWRTLSLAALMAALLKVQQSHDLHEIANTQ